MPLPSRASTVRLAVLCIALAGAPISVATAAADPPDDPAPTSRVDDPTRRVSDNGRVYYVDPARPGTPTRPKARPGSARAPLEETFELHSKPDSRRTIYLDFTGHTVSGTEWNAGPNGLPNGFYEAWDPAGNGTGFSASERTMVQEIWAIAAEDYAPFDVDVTTENPGNAAIHRSGGADKVFGTRVLLTDNPIAHKHFDDTFGIAFDDAFDETIDHELYQPAWVFPQDYSMKAVADTVSHEVGHNLSLDHDGKGDDEYYEGHGAWGPIMGSSDYRPIAQWSNGDYGGSNTENDIAVIAASGAPLRKDEAGSTVDTAAAFPLAPAYISTRHDQDVYALGECEGPLTLKAQPAPLSPNLDIRLELLGSSGTVLSFDDPPSAGIDEDTATGLAASISGTASGTYYVRVDGVGRGNPATSYSDFGSLGAYTLDATGDCDFAPPPDAAPERPGKPTITRVTPGRPGGKKTATVRWRPPGNAEAAEIEGYQLRAYKIRNRRVVRTFTTGIYPADTRRAVWKQRSRQRYKFRVRAVNELGNGPWSKRSRAVTLR